MVRQMSSEKKIEIDLSCKVLAVSRSGYYSWLGRPECVREKENKLLLEKMRQIYQESRGTYGLPRIQAKLRQLGTFCGKSRLHCLMKRAGICGLKRKRFRIKTTDSNHLLPIAPRHFKTENPKTHPLRPNQVWASDISYIQTLEGFLFLAIYLDLFTRKVVGFATSTSMHTELIVSAIEMALGRQKIIQGEELLSHSDRGSQYASEHYRAILTKEEITASMSRRGNCYDNAFAESFFATLKKELIYRHVYSTKDEAKKAIFEYIEVWYNRQRLHSSLGYKTPIQFEESLAA